MFQETKPSTVDLNPIFCCGSAEPIHLFRDTKLHNDTNRDLHDAIFGSFLAYASRRQCSADFMALILSYSRPGSSAAASKKADPPTLPPAPEPIFTHELIKNNPLKPNIPYVIHLTARHDFGPVYSHRYFLVPSNLEHDWMEISLLEWFAAGNAFKLRAEKWDMKCVEDSKFFRMTLRPNLAMRGCYPVDVPQESSEWEMRRAES